MSTPADPLATRTEAAPRQAALSHAQRQLLLSQSMACLADVAGVHRLLERQGQLSGKTYAVISEGLAALTGYIHAGRALVRAEQQEAREPAPAPAAAPAEAPPEYRAIGAFTHTLGNRQGAVSEGPEVDRLQRLLGLEGLSVPLTGQYDRSTTLAVRRLQQQHGLRQQDGLVGGETRRLLNRLTGQGA